jgi:energy-coupling factor transport system ATP-binding protein
VIHAEALSYRYRHDDSGLAQTDFAVAAGERWLVSGPSGCGKSTLARCLTGLIPHLYRGTLQGRVRVRGQDTAGAPLWQIAEAAGLLFQNPASQMLAATVEDEIIFGLENLGLPRAEIAERLEAALTRFGLAGLRSRAPQTLSGGEQQKLALAAVMARQPAVLALDEPLSMLDSTAAIELVAHLAELAAAVIICEHREEYLTHLPGLRTLRLASRQTAGDPVPLAAVPTFDLQTPPFALEARGLSVRLGERTVLDRLDFAARGGEVVAVVGRNGVGKTTLLRALAGLQKYTGSIIVGHGAPDLGLVFQNAELQLFNASVRAEILYRVPDPDMALYAQLLGALGLARYEHTPPLLLSEGEKKRVALATVLMRRPRHGVLLDEPSLGQDRAHKAMLVRMARGLAGAGQLVIMTTHDLTLAAHADRLVLLGAEGPVADGPPAHVLADPVPWARIGLIVPDWVMGDAEGGLG